MLAPSSLTDTVHRSANQSEINLPWFQRRGFWALIAVTISGAYVFSSLGTGWFPWDEGQLGQSALRVMEGELPHRDFDDMYTGALTYLNAMAFKLFGHRSESARWMMWLFFLPYTYVLYSILSRFTPGWGSALVTITASTITLPAYSAAMPSWYNLFFLTFAVGCGFHFVDTRNRCWLFAAGLCIGISILFKITGIVGLAALILFVIHFEQETSPESDARSYVFDGFIVSGLAVFVLLSAKISLGIEGLQIKALNTLHLGLPMVAIAGFLVHGQLRCGRGKSGYRFKRFFGMQIPLCAGALVPVAALVGFYIWQGALGSLYEGLVELPAYRYEMAMRSFPEWLWLIPCLPHLALILLSYFRPQFFQYRFSLPVVLISSLLAGMWLYGLTDPFTWYLSFSAFRNSIPFVALLALGYLFGKFTDDPKDRQHLFLLVAALVMGSLIQFPYAIDIYFLYIAPLLLVLGTYLLMKLPTGTKVIHTAWLAGFLLTAFFRMSTPFPNNNTYGLLPKDPAESMQMTRCSLIVPRYDARMYRELVDHLHRLTDEGDVIFAGPDAPEIYFLANRKNPTRIMYDFFRPEIVEDATGLTKQLRKANVRVVVLRTSAIFSRLNSKLEEEVRRYYPDQIEIFRETVSKGRESMFRIYYRSSRLPDNQQRTAERHSQSTDR